MLSSPHTHRCRGGRGGRAVSSRGTDLFNGNSVLIDKQNHAAGAPFPAAPSIVRQGLRLASRDGDLLHQSLRSATNPRYLLSGDQNGYVASSVPCNIVACAASSARTQRLVIPFSSTAENASVLPSGETATGPASNPVGTNCRSGGRTECKARTMVLRGSEECKRAPKAWECRHAARSKRKAPRR